MASKKKKKPTAKKKVTSSKPAKKKAAARRGGGRRRGHGGHDGPGDNEGGKGPLTPQNDKANATIVPVSSYTALDGYWNLLRNVYRPVIVQVDSKAGTVIEFYILSPDDGLPFSDGGGPKLFEVDLEDGDVAYPYFPSTAQLVTLPGSNDVGYLLLSCDWLDEALDSSVNEYAGDKIPPGCSL